MVRHLCLVFVIAAGVGSRALALGPVPVKQVVAPPGDIESGLLKVPDPVELGVLSRTALIRIDASMADERGVVELPAPVALGDGPARVVFLPEKQGAWVGSVAVDGRTVRTDDPIARLDSAGASIVRDPIPWSGSSRVYDALTLQSDQRSCVVRVELTERVGGYVLIDPDPDRSLYSYVEQRRTVAGRAVSLAASLTDGSRIDTLEAVVRAPDGTETTVRAEPGSSAVGFTPEAPGRYSVRMIAAYTDRLGRAVTLTAQHLVVVESERTPLGGAWFRMKDGAIEFSFNDDARNDRVVLAAEVWGQRDGRWVPVCWLARVCDARRSLELDPAWIERAGVDPESIELRALRVHDVDSMVPTEIVDRVPVDQRSIPFGAIGHGSERTGPIMVDAPERAGVGEQGIGAQGVGVGGHRLLLVHGYCSGGNPFPVGDFSGPTAVFHDPEVSRSHDAFALEILEQTRSLKSFGVAAHSQGAMAALHLSTFYFSPMDWARDGERLIQSVGAPYQGTALAGNAAVLGDIFGFGCGVNDDMTYAGAANWLSLIPGASRANVWYWTTSFEDRAFVFDYCNIITDLLLDDPDDGVIERSAGQLSGATNMGHTEGWCHTTGMRDPAQCTDQSRNSQIDQEAKR